MHIGILQCGHTPEAVSEVHGDFDALFETLFDGQGLTFSTWDVVDMDFPATIHEADGWLLTGSRHGAYEEHAFIPALKDFIRELNSARKPVIGICFGHQIVAEALGGRVEKFAGGWAIGRHGYVIDGEEVHLNAWHQDQVIEPPDSARTVGSSPFCEHAVLVYGNHIMTVQPHPEISNDVLSAYLESRGQDPIFPRDKINTARAMLGSLGDEPRLATRLARFLKDARP
ncbi:MAG: type 1 glutamine amidotransferase [Pseudomonadota bacterium]